MSNKRVADEQLGGDVSKARKTSSTRTGQACDRCKVRKIRCDARPGGCSPCLQNNTECKTTDRITGRATSRGHTENVETENVSLRLYVAELQQQLRSNNVEPVAPPIAPPYQAPSSSFLSPWDTVSPTSNGYAGGERQASAGSLLPEFRAGCVGDNYLGVASENNWLSPIEGSSLALFGTRLNLADFMPPEPNFDAEATSYQTFLKHAFGQVRVDTPDLPAYEQCKQYAEWYFRSVQVFIPLLHKPHFFDLLDRIYNHGHQPSPAETVMVHMVLSVMYFQYSARNESPDTRRMSFEHYHYCLTFIPQLFISHQLVDLQALGLICSQLRNQPRLGASWMFNNMVLGLAIESGLHRSASAWSSAGTNQDPHLVEMRKRIFWTILLFTVNCSGNLGRPMPLRFEDFDIEIPEAIDDLLPGEQAPSQFKQCSFRGGIEGFKILRILMQIYSTVYAIRMSPGSYEAHVRQLDKDLSTFEAQIPDELSGGPQTMGEDRIAALYLQLSIEECQLLLHHPSLNRSGSPQTAASNLDICLEASRRMMQTASQLKSLRSLDTTLYYAVDFLAAIFTTIFAYTERKHTLTPRNMQQLRQDMDQWLDILGPVGQMLGTGLRLQGAMTSIIDRHLQDIEHHIAANTASAAVARVNSAQQQAASGLDGGQSQPPPSIPSQYEEKYAPPPAPGGDYYSTPYNNPPPAQAFTPTTPLAIAPPPPLHQSMPPPEQHTMAPATVVNFENASWRNFAENMMAGNAGGMPVTHANFGGSTVGTPIMTTPITPGAVNGGHLAATFGGMQLPDTAQQWPMAQYSVLPPDTNGDVKYQ